MSHDRDCHHTYRQPPQANIETPSSSLPIPSSQPPADLSTSSTAVATDVSTGSKLSLLARVSKSDVVGIFRDHSRSAIASPTPASPINGSSGDSPSSKSDSSSTRSMVQLLPNEYIRATGQRTHELFVNHGSSLKQGSLSEYEKQVFEPAVSAIDHIASEGFEHESAATVRELMDAIPSMPKELCELICGYRISTHGPFFWSKRYGASHNDSRPFTTLDSTSVMLVVAGYHVTKIIGFSNKFANGVQLEYGPYGSSISSSATSDATSPSAAAAEAEQQPHVLGSNMFSRKIVKKRSGRPSGGSSSSPASSSSSSSNSSSATNATADNHTYTAFALVGTHDDPEKREFVLQSDEFITGVDFFVGQYGDSLLFHTSLDRQFRLGRSNGGSPVEFRAPPGMALVALQGAVGGHLHNIAVCFAPLAPWRETLESQ